MSRDHDREYAKVAQDFPEYPAEVVESVTIDGVGVDIIRNTSVTRTTQDGPVEARPAGLLEAYRAGSYELLAPRVTWYINDGQYHTAGAVAHGGCSRVIEPGTARPDGGYRSAIALSRSATVKGAITGARKALRTAALLEQYGKVAVANIRTLDGDEFHALPVDQPINPGDLVAAYGHQRYRVGVAIEVNSGGTVRYLFATPTGRYPIGGSGKGDKVRLYRAAEPVAPTGKTIAEMTPAEQASTIAEAGAKFQDELTHTAPAVAEALELPLSSQVAEPGVDAPAVAPAERAFRADGVPCGRPVAEVTIDQARIDAPSFPRGVAWWREFLPCWVGVRVDSAGMVHVMADTTARVQAAHQWLTGAAGGRLAAALGQPGPLPPRAVATPAAQAVTDPATWLARFTAERAAEMASVAARAAADVDEPITDPAEDDPTVWVTVWRKGADHHRIADEHTSGCDRHILIGNRVRRSEAVGQLGSRPCARCYVDDAPPPFWNPDYHGLLTGT